MPAVRIKIKKDRCPVNASCLWSGSCQDKRLTVDQEEDGFYRHGGGGAPLLCPDKAIVVMGSAELGPVVVEKTDDHPELRVGHEVKFGMYVGIIVPLEEAEAATEWAQPGLREGYVPLKLEEPFKGRSYFETDPKTLKIV